MNEIAKKSIISLLNPSFEINKIEFKKIPGYTKEKLNCFVFFTYKEEDFIAWEILPSRNNDGTYHSIQDKSLAININLADHIGYIEKTLFAEAEHTTGDKEKYSQDKLSSLLFDQLHSYDELGMTNNKFRTLDKRINYNIINEEIDSRKPIEHNALKIFKEILQLYGIGTSNYNHV